MDKKSNDQTAKGSTKWGYKKTDPDSHWVSGAPSPNPAGRLKGSKNQKTLYHEAMGVKILAKLGDKTKLIAKGALGYHQLANKSAGGDLKAIALQVQLDAKFDEPDTTPPSAADTASDLGTLDQYIALQAKYTKLSAQAEAAGE